MKRESRTVDRSHQIDSPTQRHLPLVDLLVDTRAELMELAVASGLKVLNAMLEEDRTAICGPRYQHQIARKATRAGTVSSEVVLGGRKVQIRRPRVRATMKKSRCPRFRRSPTPTARSRVVEQMLVGVARATMDGASNRRRRRRHARTSKSAVSRRFVAKTTAQLDAWRSTALDALDLVALVIDGVHVGEHCIVVASASTPREETRLASGTARRKIRRLSELLANLQSRGLRTDRTCW